jgi:hypothetical protein
MDSPTPAPTGSLTSHLTQTPQASPDTSNTPPTGIHLGREHVKSWTPEVWDRIDRAVHHEMHRTRVAAKFLPHHRVDPHVTTVPAGVVLASLNGPAFVGSLTPAIQGATPPLLNIDEGATIRLIEIWTEFSLTTAQVQEETRAHAAHKEQRGDHTEYESHSGHDDHHHHKHHPSSTAITLARRAANILSLAQDTVIFQGLNAFPKPPAAPGGQLVGGSLLFSSQTVQYRGVLLDTGLLCIGGPTITALQVLPTNTPPAPTGGGLPASIAAQYSENTVAQINSAYSILSGNGYPGPYACVLHFYPYADSFAPLQKTLILPADRIKPLMEEGYYPSSALPGIAAPQTPQNQATLPNPPILPVTPAPAAGPAPTPRIPAQAAGFVISLGGNTVDLVNGLDPVTAFSQVDATGNFTFRVLTRFALRLKDPNAVVRLEFQ